MNKQAPSPARILIMVAFALSCFGLLLFLWLAFGGPTPLKPQGYRFQVSFGEATQLAKEADVRISGVPVGKVKDIVTDPTTGRSNATIQLEARYAPLPKDAKAILRSKTLLGETYVELTPGTPDSAKIPDGGKLGRAQVAETVELDEIFRAFDPKTRDAFRTWIQQQAIAVDGRGEDFSDAIGNLAPFAQNTDELLRLLNSQTSAVRQVVRNTGTVLGALSERNGELASLITNSNRVFATTAARDKELADTFRALPAFERESTLTVRRLKAFAQRSDPLVKQLLPAAQELSPTLVSLSKVAPDLRDIFTNLGPLISASDKGLPATQKFVKTLAPLLGEFDPFLAQLNPILDGASLYKKEISAFFSNSAAATQGSQATAGSKDPVHYLRVTNPLSPENLAYYPKRIGSNRSNPYPLPGAFAALPTGLSVFDTRGCANPTPRLDDSVFTTLPGDLAQRVQQFAFAGGNVTSPECKQQARYDVSGKITRFPQVAADPQGLRAGLPQP